jgi:hypothetical protein
VPEYVDLFKRIQYTKASVRNNDTYDDYFSRLRVLATSMFEWRGLPESVNVRYLEQALFMTGRALFFKDPEKGFMALACIPSSSLNFYLEPVKYMATSLGYTREYNRDESILIRNNYDQHPTEATIRLYAYRLTHAERVMDINIGAQRTPYIIACDEKQRMTIKNVMAQHEGNEPLIIVDKSLDPDKLRSIVTPAPFITDKLQDYKTSVWNEAMTFLGINNAMDKRERLITDEVQANDQLIRASAEVMLLCRQTAAAEIKKMFGLDVAVDIRKNFVVEQADPALNPGQETNGKPGENGGVEK